MAGFIITHRGEWHIANHEFRHLFEHARQVLTDRSDRELLQKAQALQILLLDELGHDQAERVSAALVNAALAIQHAEHPARDAREAQFRNSLSRLLGLLS